MISVTETFEQIKKCCGKLSYCNGGYIFYAPVTEEELSAWEQENKICLPVAYRELLLLCNGMYLDEVIEIFSIRKIFKLDDCGSTYDGFFSIGTYFGSKLLIDGKGNFYIDKREGKKEEMEFAAFLSGRIIEDLKGRKGYYISLKKNRKWNQRLTFWGMVMLVLLFVWWFIPAEGTLGLIKVTLFYLILLFYEIVAIVMLPVILTDRKKMNSRKDNILTSFGVLLVLIGIFVIPRSIICCGMDLVLGTEKIRVCTTSVKKHEHRRSPDSYELLTEYGCYKIEYGTYSELYGMEGVDMDITVYPRTKVLVSYEIVE